jgi:Oxidoreductase family, NAD-binding Rossmann fold/Oxidoreductase family, C-terminal alpha/beta domain
MRADYSKIPDNVSGPAENAVRRIGPVDRHQACRGRDSQVERGEAMAQTGHLNRREFLVPAAAGIAFTVVPRNVLGGQGVVAPSDKITLAHIGCGTEGLREMLDILPLPDVQIVAVCDPVKDGSNYVDWSKDDVRSSIAEAMGQPNWRKGKPGIPGGREVARELIETVYAKQRGADQFKGCATYADFRELFEKQTDITAVKIMTPDHLHATISLAAMKKGKHVIVHKPISNRLHEARLVVAAARQTKLNTHFMPASDGALIRVIKGWIDEGAIGTLREIHNWSSRPMWPQYATIPTDRPKIPKGFDWQLWLGPSLDRPYHPHYTNAVFRGWYEFGGGSVADMGHYSLWPVFQQFNLDAPYWVESRPSHLCSIEDGVSRRIKNDYSFPAACTIRYKFAAKGGRGPLDIFWYDGSITPPTPDEMIGDNQELEREGMLFVGDKGKIVAGFRGETPRLIPEQKMKEFRIAKNLPEPAPRRRGGPRPVETPPWVAAFKGGAPTYGDFTLAEPISDFVNLGAVSLRMGGKRLLWDAANEKITNLADANKYLVREYRKGWEL